MATKRRARVVDAQVKVTIQVVEGLLGHAVLGTVLTAIAPPRAVGSSQVTHLCVGGVEPGEHSEWASLLLVCLGMVLYRHRLESMRSGAV